MMLGEDEALVAAIAANMRRNNAFISNFFQYYNGVRDAFARNGAMPASEILEIGCGNRPYTGMRFLLEGAHRYVANDLGDINGSFSSDFVNSLKEACAALAQSAFFNFDRVFRPNGDGYELLGLELFGGRPFDKLHISGDVDLAFSTSVLEHVMAPKLVARRLAEVVAPGGYMYHSIDFRDHRDFKRPFDFYKLTDDEYVPSASENRLRPSDWLSLFNNAGFEIIERYDCAMSPDSIAAGHSHSECSYRWYLNSDEIVPSFTEAERGTFVEPFRSKALADLSITCTQLLCRKRT